VRLKGASGGRGHAVPCPRHMLGGEERLDIFSFSFSYSKKKSNFLYPEKGFFPF
jgi:hypothetical protein